MLGPKEPYVKMFNRAIQDRSNNQVAKFPLRPSSSGDCRRKLAYQLEEWLGLMSYEKGQLGARKLRIFKAGHAVEYDLKQQVKDCDGFTVKYRWQAVDFYSIEDDQNKGLRFKVQGSNDDCFCPTDEFDPEFGKGLVDYKSKGDKWEAAYKTGWDETNDKLSKIARKVCDTTTKEDNRGDTEFWVEDLEKFLEDLNDPFFAKNFYQLNGYARTEFFKAQGVDHCVLIQSNKNDSRIRVIRFKPCDKVYEKCKSIFEDVLNAVAQGSAEYAPRDSNLGSSMCSLCPYSKQCWDGADATKAFFKTLPPKKWPVDIWKLNDQNLKYLFGKHCHDSEYIKNKFKAREEEIIKKMLAHKIQKIKLDNGEVWMLKWLKTPKPHYELRRGKL